MSFLSDLSDPNVGIVYIFVAVVGFASLMLPYMWSRQWKEIARIDAEMDKQEET
jgi:hypothetical protein